MSRHLNDPGRLLVTTAFRVGNRAPRPFLVARGSPVRVLVVKSIPSFSPARNRIAPA